MTNLTSELVEEFREKYQILLRFGSIEDAAKSDKVEVVNQEIGNWLKAAFDRVRAEGRREAVEYIKGEVPKVISEVVDKLELEEILKEAASVDNPLE